MTPALHILAANEIIAPVASGWQLIVAALAGIALIVVLITVANLHPFLALIFGAVTAGIAPHGRARRHALRRIDHRRTEG